MSWRDFPQTADQLREAGLGVISVHSPSQNINPTVIIVRWDHEPEPHEKHLARHYIPVADVRHVGPSEQPKGCPWA